MTDEGSEVVLERINRLTQAIADLIDSHAAQGRTISRVLELQGKQLGRIEAQIALWRSKTD